MTDTITTSPKPFDTVNKLNEVITSVDSLNTNLSAVSRDRNLGKYTTTGLYMDTFVDLSCINGTSCFSYTPTGNSIMQLDPCLSDNYLPLGYNHQAYRECYLVIKMINGVYSLTFPSSWFQWAGGDAPDMSLAGIYVIRLLFIRQGDDLKCYGVYEGRYDN